MSTHLPFQSVFATALALALSASPASAQTPAVETIALTGTAGAVRLRGDTKDVELTMPPQGALALTFTCAAGLDCATLAVETEPPNVIAKQRATADSARFSVPAGQKAAITATVLVGGVAAPATIKLAPSAEPRTATDESLAALLATRCVPADSLQRGDTVLVSPVGQVLYTPHPRGVADVDPVWVRVLGHEQLLKIVVPAPGSEVAALSVTNNYGQEFLDQARSLVATADEACEASEAVPVGPLAAPRGVVNLELRNGGEPKTLGSFKLPVAETYTGAFAIGGVGSTVESATFEKVFTGTDTVVSRRDGGRRLLYTLTYTHFVWGRRDLTRPAPAVWERINPIVGVVLNDIANNAIAGVSLELRPGLAFTAGQHVARVSTIDPRSGATVGEAYENRAASVPTDKRWVSKAYYGVLVDVQAAGTLLKSLLGSGS